MKLHHLFESTELATVTASPINKMVLHRVQNFQEICSAILRAFNDPSKENLKKLNSFSEYPFMKKFNEESEGLETSFEILDLLKRSFLNIDSPFVDITLDEYEAAIAVDTSEYNYSYVNFPKDHLDSPVHMLEFTKRLTNDINHERIHDEDELQLLKQF